MQEVTTEQAARILKCSPRTIRYMIRRGTITARMSRIDPTTQKGVYKIPISEIARIKAAQKTAART